MPYATRHMLNQGGWRIRREAQKIISTKFVERNKWTKGSVQVIETQSLVVRGQEVRVGSIQQYMEYQEYGHTEIAKGKHGVPIPTSYSAGQDGMRPRTKLPRRPNQMRNINLSRSRKGGGSIKQRLMRTVQEAVTTGNRVVFIDFGPGKRKGIMRVLGGRKKFKRGWPPGARLKMIQNLSHRSIRIRPRKWLEPAVERSKKGMARDYREALLFQLRRNTRFR